MTLHAVATVTCDGHGCQATLDLPSLLRSAYTLDDAGWVVMHQLEGGPRHYCPDHGSIHRRSR